MSWCGLGFCSCGRCDVEPDRAAAAFLRAAVRGLHDPRSAAGHDREAALREVLAPAGAPRGSSRGRASCARCRRSRRPGFTSRISSMPSTNSERIRKIRHGSLMNSAARWSGPVCARFNASRIGADGSSKAESAPLRAGRSGRGRSSRAVSSQTSGVGACVWTAGTWERDIGRKARAA